MVGTMQGQLVKVDNPNSQGPLKMQILPFTTEKLLLNTSIMENINVIFHDTARVVSKNWQSQRL